MTVQCLLDVGEVMCFQFDSKVYMTESVALHRSYHNQSSYTYHLLQTPIAHTFKHQHFIKQNRVDFRLQHHNSPPKYTDSLSYLRTVQLTGIPLTVIINRWMQHKHGTSIQGTR